jgi:hypothetical protein
MVKVFIPQHFCSRCGTAVGTNQRYCQNCGIHVAASGQPTGEENEISDAEATQRVSSRVLSSLYLYKENCLPGEDTQRLSSHLASNINENDNSASAETVRAAPRLSSSIHEKAAQQEAHLVSAAPEPEPSLQKQKQLFAKNRWATKKIFVSMGCVLGLLLLLTFIVSGVVVSRPDPRVEQQVQQNRSQLDRLIHRAVILGVPISLLQPVLKQEQVLNSSNAPVALFNKQPGTSYDQYLAQRYHVLFAQVPAVITAATEQFQLQAQQDMQNFQTALSGANMQGGHDIQSFAQQFSQDQFLLASAQYPKDFATISQNAHQAILSLNAMKTTFKQLTDFQATISRMNAAHLDVTAAQAEYQNDLQLFDHAAQPRDFQDLTTQINAQYQQVVVNSIQAFPYVSITKLNELESQVNLLKTYGMDVSSYQARLNSDQVAEGNAKTVFDELVFFNQVDADIASMQDDLARGEAHYLVRQFHREVTAWAQAHLYHDSFDGHNYALDDGYMQAGIGSVLDRDLASAGTTADFEAMIDEARNAIFNLHMLEADYNDHAAYDQVHAADLRVISHYKLQTKQLLMVSLVEQAMRVYQNGKLVHSYHVTTGRQELPSLPGVWSVLDRKSPIIFTAAEPKGSPFWFPDTPISYAILYHYGGYFVHDAPWRANFGPGTQFPHQDSSGTTAYNFDGSHGCINLSEGDATWVYHHTDWNTVIVIY